MSGAAISGLLALVGGVVVIAIGFAPYVAFSYRRHGRFAPGRALLAVAIAIYAVALWTYTILPLPDPAHVCDDPPAAQWIPFHFLVDAARATASAQTITAQVLLNVALFIPLGMIVRHSFRRGPVTTITIGVAVSVLIELTQLSGNWGIYSCAYRVFDVDDIIANTTGAGLGFLIAPVLGLLPGQGEHNPHQPAPVTSARRLLGMMVDATLVVVVPVLMWLPIGSTLVATGALSRTQAGATWVAPTLRLLAAIVFLVAVPLARHGATLGQTAVLLRPQTDAGTPPSRRAQLTRSLTGSGGFFLLWTLGDLLYPSLGTLAILFGALSLTVATQGDHRGLSGIIAGIRIADAREPMHASSPTQRWAGGLELRSMWLAIVALAALLHLGFVGFILAVRAGGAIAAVAALIVLVVAGAAMVGGVGFLILNGLLMIRREGRSLGNLLTLLTGVAFVGLTGLTAVAIGGDWGSLLLPTLIVWVIVAYASFLFWAFALFGLFYAHRSPQPDADAVIVLGSRIFGTRVPPLLASRLDTAATVFATQTAAGATPVLVCSGGQGPGEDQPEADAMADYLIAAGVPAAAIRRETQSRSTAENLTLSAQLLRAEGRGERVIAVTNDFHAFRAALITREQKVLAQVIGAPTAHYFLPSALLREFIAVLARKPWAHLAVVAIIIAAGILARM